MTTEAPEKDQMHLEVRVNLVKDKDSKIRAYASIRISSIPKLGAFALNHIRIIAGKNGLFVGMPSQLKKVEGQPDVYYDHFHPVTKEGREAVTELVLEAYEKKLASQ